MKQKGLRIVISFVIAVVAWFVISNLAMAVPADPTPWIYEQSGTLVVDLCGSDQEVIAEGQFANQIGGDELAGAKWELCADGVSMVSEGFVNWVSPSNFPSTFESPWHAYRTDINRIEFTGPIAAGRSLENLFGSLENVTEIVGLTCFDTSQVRDMSWMFYGVHQLTSLNLSNFDTNNVTNMSAMFAGANSLTSLDLSNFDTSNVTNMDSMFLGANSLTSLDLSNFDTSNVTNMSGMFVWAMSLLDLDLSSFDTSNVTDMSWMFTWAISLTNLDLSSFDTSSVTSMDIMFAGASSLTNLDLSSFDTSNVTSMSGMFRGAYDLRELTLGESFAFVGSASLPEISKTDEFAGMWQNVGNGSVSNPTGVNVFTSADLMEQFDGSTMADTFVWQPVRDSERTPRETLRELIAETEARIQANYTPLSWARMQSMLVIARNVYNNPTAADVQINDAISLLRARLDELVRR